MSLSPSGAAGNVLPKGYKTGQLQQFTPEQMQDFKNMFAFTDPSSQLYQRAMGSEEGFAPMEQRAQRDFQQFQGDLSSRFSGLGLGGRHGSGFQNLATQGAQDFASSLAEKRQGIQRQALMDLRGLSSELLGHKPYEQFMIEKERKEPWWKKALGIGLPVAGAVAGGVVGGPAGALAGAQFGNTLASPFTGGSGQGNYEGISSLPTSWRRQQSTQPQFHPAQFQGGYENAGDLSSISTPGGYYG